MQLIIVILISFILLLDCSNDLLFMLSSYINQISFIFHLILLKHGIQLFYLSFKKCLFLLEVKC
jgi:hypothetical protein